MDITTHGIQVVSEEAVWIRIVIYAHMSTEHQKYSIENQSNIILVFSAEKNMDVIRIYADDGKNGLDSTTGLLLGCQTHKDNS